MVRMKDTPLTPLHRRLGAGMGADSGWNMPLQYTNLIDEHLSTRSACGIFDISDTGKFRIRGNGALECLEGLLSNTIADCRDGNTQQSLLLRGDGMILDRITLCRESAGSFFIIGSASQTQADYESLRRDVRHGALELVNETDALCGIALQGPDAARILSRVHFAAELPRRGEFCRFKRGGQRCLLTRAGLVSEDSLELFCPAASGIAWFEQLMAAGAIPCGLRTRELLRLERGRADMGKDAASLTPTAAGLTHLCSTEKEYTGSDILQSTPETEGKLVALHGTTQGHEFSPGDSVHDPNGRHIGNITSAAASPAGGQSYAIAYVSSEHSAPGTHVWVQTDGCSVPAQVKAQS